MPTFQNRDHVDELIRMGRFQVRAVQFDVMEHSWKWSMISAPMS